jgi:hypothetical protein
MCLNKRREVEIEVFSKYFNKLVRIGTIITSKWEKNQFRYKLNDILMLMAYGKRSNHLTVHTASFAAKRTRATAPTIYSRKKKGFNDSKER